MGRLRSLIRNGAMALAAAVALAALGSCDSWVYKGEGDCAVQYRLTFRYDRNLKWADAFANEVTSVNVYAFDPSGLLLWQHQERVDPASAADYSVLLDLPAGSYRLLAWCGLLNDGERPESFSVPAAQVGATRIKQVECALNRQRDPSTGSAYSDGQLYRLFHGTLDVTLPDAGEEGGTFTYTMPLTKDTNHVRVILQQLSGEDVDVGQFTFRIEDDNGLLAYDNSLLPDEPIAYRPWKTQSGEAGVGKVDAGSIVQVKGAIADLTVGRMMESHRKQMMLTITDREGKAVARVPVIDYALLAKDFYEEEYGHAMTDQEFLDREDDYVMTFFLDEAHQWVSSQIMIHSWIVVLQDVELE